MLLLLCLSLFSSRHLVFFFFNVMLRFDVAISALSTKFYGSAQKEGEKAERNQFRREKNINWMTWTKVEMLYKKMKNSNTKKQQRHTLTAYIIKAVESNLPQMCFSYVCVTDCCSVMTILGCKSWNINTEFARLWLLYTHANDGYFVVQISFVCIDFVHKHLTRVSSSQQCYSTAQ